MTALDHHGRTAMEVSTYAPMLQVLRSELNRRAHCEAVSMGLQARLGAGSHFSKGFPE